MVVITAIVANVLIAAAPGDQLIFPKGFVELFESCEYRDEGQSPPRVFPYRLFVPRNQKPGEKHPLLLWLHGAGEAGSDNRKNLRWLDLVLDHPAHIEKYRFYILAVQYPEKDAGDMPSVTYEILQKTLREQPVDEDRVYLSGVSSGGSGCWSMALRYPGVFAAVAPLASGAGDVSQAQTLVHLPIWVFHNVYDERASAADVEAMVAAIERAGGNVHVTLLEAGGHDCWQQAFVRYGLMAWMLDQRRGAWICWTPPGCRSWRWWHVFGVPGALALVVAAGWCSERRRRRRLSKAAGRSKSEKAHDG